MHALFNGEDASAELLCYKTVKKPHGNDVRAWTRRPKCKTKCKEYPECKTEGSIAVTDNRRIRQRWTTTARESFELPGVDPLPKD